MKNNRGIAFRDFVYHTFLIISVFAISCCQQIQKSGTYSDSVFYPVDTLVTCISKSGNLNSSQLYISDNCSAFNLISFIIEEHKGKKSNARFLGYLVPSL